MNDVTEEIVKVAAVLCEKFGRQVGMLDKEQWMPIARAALAARPKVSGEAVEAARSMIKRQGWDGWVCSIRDAEIIDIIEAADAARGYAFVRWHRAEVDPRVSANTTTILVARQSADDRYVMERNAKIALPLDAFAWADMPPPPWAQTAPPVAPSPKVNQSTDAASILARCGIPTGCDRKAYCAAHGECGYTGTPLVPTPPAVIPVTQTTGDAHEAPVGGGNATTHPMNYEIATAPVAEPAPVFTKEMAALLDDIAWSVARLQHHVGWLPRGNQTEQLRRTAFPDPAP